MKRQYEVPVAEKLEFNYLENVIASANNGNKKANANSCYKHNGNNVNKACGPDTGAIPKNNELPAMDELPGMN